MKKEVERSSPTSIKLPVDLREKVKDLAERERRTFSNAIEIIIDRYFECSDKKAGARATSVKEARDG